MVSEDTSSVASRKRRNAQWPLLFCGFLTILAISGSLTCGILYLINKPTFNPPATKVIGSVRIEELAGGRIHWEEAKMNSAGLVQSLEHALQDCLDDVHPSSVEIISIRNDDLSEVLGLKDRGVIVTWSIGLDSLSGEVAPSSIARLITDCKNGITLDPESIHIGRMAGTSTQSARSLENLLSEIGKFDLRNMQFETATTPKFMSDFTCSPLQNPEYGNVSPLACTLQDRITVGMTCSFSCHTGKSLLGFGSLICLSSGHWSHLTPICTSFCPALPHIQNGGIYPAECVDKPVVPATRCFYYCDTNFVLDGTLLMCTEEGVWEGSVPLCKKTCSLLSVPEDGDILPMACAYRRSPAESVCSFACHSGYTMSGSDSLLCGIDGNWNGPPPVCNRGCSLLKTVANGETNPPSCIADGVVDESVMEGMICLHTCNEGYMLQGTSERMCLQGGVWSGDEPECKRVCPPLMASGGVNYLPRSCMLEVSVQGTKCSSFCEDERTLFGDSTTLVCMEDGSWSSSDASCMSTCNPLPPVANGIVTPSCVDQDVMLSEGVECVVICDDGHALDGQPTITCLGRNEWSAPVAKCLKMCEPLVTTEFVTVSPVNCSTDVVYEGQNCDFSCEEDYELTGLPFLTCLDDGSWSGEVPICTVLTLVVLRQKTAYHDICLAVNSRTMRVNRYDIEECAELNEAAWWRFISTGMILNAATQKCLSVSTPHSVGSLLVVVDCKEEELHQKWEWIDEDEFHSIAMKDMNLYPSFGYMQLDSVTLTDEKTELSEWFSEDVDSAIMGERTGGSCHKLKNSSYVVEPSDCVVKNTVENGTVCRISCPHNFKLYGSSELTCIDGRWDNMSSKCERACSPLSSPLNGSVTPACEMDMQDLGMICQYQCEERYQLVGAQKSTCLQHGEWSDPAPDCIETCAPLEVEENGNIEPLECTESVRLIGTQCRLNCILPYSVQGSEVRTCTSGGNWSSSWSCLRTCHMEPVENGQTDCLNDPIYSGTLCTYTCKPSYRLMIADETFGDSVVRMCQDDGLFNGSVPVCKVTCPVLTAIENGTISPNNCSSSIAAEGDVCSVQCDVGYLIDGDASMTCMENGIWSANGTTCREEKQFVLYNDAISPPVCVLVEENMAGAVELKKYDLSNWRCSVIMRKSLWAWEGELIRHITSRLCIAIQHTETRSFSMVVLKSCDKEDPSQTWMCENGYRLRSMSFQLYLSASSGENHYLIVRSWQPTLTEEFIWKSQSAKNDTDIGDACSFSIRKCLPFDTLDHGIISPAGCLSGHQNESTVCNVACDTGYLLRNTEVQSAIMQCSLYGKWISATLSSDALPPVCLKSCPAMSAPVNGLIEHNSTCSTDFSVYGTVCQFNCSSTHVLRGSHLSVCGKTSTWTEEVPVCMASCDHAGTALGLHALSPYKEYPSVHGCLETSENIQSVLEDAVCTYTCPGSLELVGAAERICLPSGNFDLPLGVCEYPSGTRTSCPHPPGAPDLIQQCRLVDHDPSTEHICALYSCGPDYVMIGEPLLHCNEVTGIWPSPPACKKKCESTSPYCQNMYEGQTCFYMCPTGHKLSHGEGILECLMDGTWNDTEPACIPGPDYIMKTAISSSVEKYCLLPEIMEAPFARAFAIVAEFSGQRTARWRWLGSHNLMNSASSLCMSVQDFRHGQRVQLATCDTLDQKQHWDCSSSTASPMQIVSKSAPSLILSTYNVLLDSPDIPFYVVLVDMELTHANYPSSTMWYGYHSDGTEASLCALRNNNANCPPLQSALLLGGSLTPASCIEEWSQTGRVCHWHCASGSEYKSSSVTAIECTRTGMWNGTAISCEHACEALKTPLNGILVTCAGDSKVPVGSSCETACDSGFQLIGENIRVCQWDGSWTGNDVICSRICNALPALGNATISPPECTDPGSVLLPGSVCNYACREGYYLDYKEATRACLENGLWSGVEPACMRVCSHLTDMAHGQISPSICTTSALYVGSVCTISCDPGYGLVGNATQECLPDGTWSGLLEGSVDLMRICVAQCNPLPTPENSEVSYTHDGEELSHYLRFYSERTVYVVLCYVGYALSGSWSRTCGAMGLWTGAQPYCTKETQFLIFLLKLLPEQQTSIQVCLYPEYDGTVAKSQDVCDVVDPSFRWAWFNTRNLKNAKTGECIGVPEPLVGQPLVLKSCNSSDPLQHWSCAAPSSANQWFLRMVDYELFPDYGFASVKSLQVYDVGLTEAEMDITWYAREAVLSTNMDGDSSFSRVICSLQSDNRLGTCNPLPPVENGEIFPSNCTEEGYNIDVGLSCSYKCDTGFELGMPEATVVCQENGLWSHPPLMCRGYCHPFDRVLHTLSHPPSCFVNEDESADHTLSTTDIHGGDSCIFACEDGYEVPSGMEFQLLCLEDGKWSGQLPRCQRICDNMIPVLHGTVSPASCFETKQVEGTVCTVQCEDGYGLKIHGQECANDVSPANDYITNNTNTTVSQNRTCLYGLTDDDKKVKEATSVCTETGSWSGDEVECISMCHPLVQPDNGQVDPIQCTEGFVLDGTACTYHCAEGFVVLGVLEKTCVDGSWVVTSSVNDTEDSVGAQKILINEASPTCERFCISAMTSNEHTLISPPECLRERVPIGTTCHLECDSESILVGPSNITCLREGAWDNFAAECILKCPPLPTLVKGKVLPSACAISSMANGAICTFSCHRKYSLEGSQLTVCNVSGQWTNPSPQCKRRCFPLPALPNGEAQPPAACFGSHITAGHSCQFSCNLGYALDGALQAVCKVDGEWDVPVPKCIRLCPKPVFEEGSLNCTDVTGVRLGRYITDHTVGSLCRVVCSEGFSPSSVSLIQCSSDGQWKPDVPDCKETGVPMYIMQSLRGAAVCISEENNRVVRIGQDDCLSTSPKDVSDKHWHWLDGFNIQNSASGKCLAVYNVEEDEEIVTAPCNTKDPLQWWECSTNNPFRLMLRGTRFSPSTYIKDSDGLVLQLWSDAHGYFSTINLNTLTTSSLCSRRPGGACPPLNDIAGGEVQPAAKCKSTAIEEGEKCSYQCTNGTVMDGEPMTMCMGNGLWMYPPPKCYGACPSILDLLPEHAYYEDPACVFDDQITNQICTADCLDGYELRGNPNRTCLPSNGWSPRLFTCEKVCPVIFGLLNGKIDPLPCRSLGCSFTCNSGYILDGASSITCLSTGEWDNAFPECMRDDQFQIVLLSLANHTLCATADVKERRLAKAKCVKENSAQLFKWISNSDQLQHKATGLCLTGRFKRWANVTLKDCSWGDLRQIWDCGDGPYSKENGLKITDAGGVSFYLDFGPGEPDHHNDTTKFGVKDWLVMENDYYLTSVWAAKHYFSEGTVCSMKDSRQCPPLVIPQNAEVNPAYCHNHTSIRKGLTCTITCEAGYTPEASMRTTCLQDGSWSTPLPVCKDLYKCEKITLSSLALQVNPPTCEKISVNHGSSCHFACSQGFIMEGTRSVTCLDRGMWSDDPPTCVKSCEALAGPENGWIEPGWCLGSNISPGTDCTMYCKEDFVLVGASVLRCKSNGIWSAVEPKCKKFCRSLNAPSAGTVYPERCITNENSEGDVCSFKCEAGLVLVGTEETTCSSGIWSTSEPECVKKTLCPDVIADPVCDVVVVFLDSSEVTGRRSALISCGDQCTIFNGSVANTCNVHGFWENGTPVCKAKCPALQPPDAGLVRPVKCFLENQPIGTVCMFLCASAEMVLHGVANTECSNNGRWSSPTPKCKKTQSDGEVLSRPFMIKQYSAAGSALCLQASVKNEYVIQVSSTLCSKRTASQLWLWRNSRNIKSASSHFCWTPVRKEGNILLGLEECDDDDTSQELACGDIKLVQQALHLELGHMNVWNSGSSIIQLVSSKALPTNGLQWEAEYTENRTNQIQLGTVMSDLTNNNTTFENLICSRMCWETFESSKGIFQSPGYPDKEYRPNVDCRWTIKAPNKKIYLWLYDINVEETAEDQHERCLKDYIRVMDGDDASPENSNVLGTMCQKSAVSGPYVSNHGVMLIRFFSDSAVVGNGFNAAWDTEALPPPNENCGYLPASQKNNAKEITTLDAPWHASIISLRRRKSICGAAFIHNQYLLSAAHCISVATSENSFDLVVGYGTADVKVLMNLVPEMISYNGSIKDSVHSQSGGYLSLIKEAYIHPNFVENVYDDIAIVKIAEVADIAPSIACFPRASHVDETFNTGWIESANMRCSVTRWDTGETGAGTLHKIRVKILSDHQCTSLSSQLKGLQVNSRTTLCATYFDELEHTMCEIDGGSGLMCEWNENIYVLGIAGFQLASCTDRNVPQYFARTSTHYEWILQHIP